MINSDLDGPEFSIYNYGGKVICKHEQNFQYIKLYWDTLFYGSFMPIIFKYSIMII